MHCSIATNVTRQEQHEQNYTPSVGSAVIVGAMPTSESANSSLTLLSAAVPRRTGNYVAAATRPSSMTLAVPLNNCCPRPHRLGTMEPSRLRGHMPSSHPRPSEAVDSSIESSVGPGAAPEVSIIRLDDEFDDWPTPSTRDGDVTPCRDDGPGRTDRNTGGTGTFVTRFQFAGSRSHHAGDRRSAAAGGQSAASRGDAKLKRAARRERKATKTLAIVLGMRLATM